MMFGGPKKKVPMPDENKHNNDADKSGTDRDADKTEHNGHGKPDKFDKPKRETDPDRTGIDTDSDKTKNIN